MKRLSLAELKAQSGNVVANLEAIKGGNTDACHLLEQAQEAARIAADKLKEAAKTFIRVCADF